jgi:enterobactin synthetase component F
MLSCAISTRLLLGAIVTGLAQADTLSMRFAKITAKSGSGSMNIARLPNRIIDLRAASDPHAAALALMQADLDRTCAWTAAIRWSAISCCGGR